MRNSGWLSLWLILTTLPAAAQTQFRVQPDATQVPIQVSQQAVQLFAEGYNYEQGRNVPKDYVKAMDYYRQAATAGHPLAEFRIGYLYERGLGVTKDYDQARSWYQKAAKDGIPNATMRLTLLPASAPP